MFGEVPLLGSDFERHWIRGVLRGVDDRRGCDLLLTASPQQLPLLSLWRLRCLTIDGLNKHNVRPDTSTLSRVVKPVPNDLSLRTAQLAVGKRAHKASFDIEDRYTDEGRRERKVEANDAEIFKSITVRGKRIRMN